MSAPRLLLHYAPGACSLASHIALEESGLAYEARGISLVRGEQKQPEYLARVPTGKVPALEVDGVTLTENVAILSYIASLAPERRLMPSEPFAQAQAMARLSWYSNTVHPSFRYVVRAELLAGQDPAAQALVGRTSRDQFLANCALIDAALAGSRWVLGEPFSVCDGYLLVFFLWMGRAKVDASAFPEFRRHARQMLERPAVRHVLGREGALADACAAVGTS